jgi:hypothetical protein
MNPRSVESPFQRGLFITAINPVEEAPSGSLPGPVTAEPAELSSAQAQRQQLADEIGEDAERIRIVQPDWLALTRASSLSTSRSAQSSIAAKPGPDHLGQDRTRTNCWPAPCSSIAMRSRTMPSMPPRTSRSQWS